MVEKSLKTTHKKREEQVLCHGLQAGHIGGNSLALAARYAGSAGCCAACVLVFTQHRSTSATLQACATQPRGVNGSSASKISLMEPIQASLRCAVAPDRQTALEPELAEVRCSV